MKYLIFYFILCLSLLSADEFEQGIELMKQKEYAQAAKHFKHAALLENKTHAALFGQVLCEVALGKYDKVEKHVAKINQLVSSCKKCDKDCPQPPESPTTAKQQITAYECRQEVRKIAYQLRTLVDTMISETVPGFLQKIRTFRQLNPYIDMLEREGLTCCQTPQTAKSCTEPLVEQLKLWNSEGLSLEPNSK